MARIFKQQYTKRNANGCKVTRESAKWYIEVTDGQTSVAGNPVLRTRRPRHNSPPNSSVVPREGAGLIDRFDEYRKRPLSQHFGDWYRSLLDNGATTQYAQLSKNRVQAILEGTKAIYWGELDANRVAAYLAERRSQGLSVESSNHYLRRIKQFARWMVKSKRAPDNPLDCLSVLNSATDHRHERRALDAGELNSLITSTWQGPIRSGMSGETRAHLYRLAAETGLRVGETRSLSTASFDLDSDPPTVVVRAAYSKHRREDTLPLRRETAELLRKWRDFANPQQSELLFPTLPVRTAEMVTLQPRAMIHARLVLR